MGYSIESVIEDNEKYVTFLKAVCVKYPDAEETRIGGETVIVSEQAAADATDVAIFQIVRGEQRETVMLPYLVLAGGRVYGSDRAPGMFAVLALEALKAHDREAYDALVAVVRDRVR